METITPAPSEHMTLPRGPLEDLRLPRELGLNSPLIYPYFLLVRPVNFSCIKYVKVHICNKEFFYFCRGHRGGKGRLRGLWWWRKKRNVAMLFRERTALSL